MTSTSTPASPSRPTAPRRSDRFFAWVDGLGLVRADGWIAGVAGGVAARLRIDPLIVRGILVVAALFGLPMLFLYAIAWALLPDVEGRIPLRAALHGRFDPALLGIAGALVLGLSPLVLAVLLGGSWLWFPSSYGYTYESPLPNGWTALFLIGAAVSLLLVSALVTLIVRAARRTPGSTDLRQASAASGEPAPAAGSGPATAEVDAGALAPASTSLSFSGQQPDEAGHESGEPSAEASPDDLQAWREQHAAWKEQEQQWRREQQDAHRIARERARAERREYAAVFAAAAAESAEQRRIRRRANPRTSAAFAAVVVGAAIVAGAMTALLGRHELTLAIGLFTAALITALGMVAAGIARRRSGFLAFATILLLVTSATAVFVPVAQALHVWGYGISNMSGDEYPSQAPLRQPWGDLSALVADTGVDGEWHIEKRHGATWITGEPGVELDIDITTGESWVASVVVSKAGSTYGSLSDDPEVTVSRLADGRTRYTGTVRVDDQPTTTRQRIVLEQTSGPIEVRLLQMSVVDEQNHGGADTLTPQPTPLPEGGTDVP